MLLRTAYVRFYRAFNYDYLRKHNPNSVRDPWDVLDDGSFYPYISVDIDPEVTCVVGANESGKSQLLEAIEAALRQKNPAPSDFCRYSAYFTVTEEMRLPHFGLHFDDLATPESEAIASLFSGSDLGAISSFKVFRTKPDKITIYVNANEEATGDLDVNVLDQVLPKIIRINAERALPDSVPIAYLVEGGPSNNVNPGVRRSDRWALIDPVVTNAAQVLSHTEPLQAFTEKLQQAFTKKPFPRAHSVSEDKEYVSELNLAFDLLVTVGGIHVSAFVALQKALRDDDQGMANGLIAYMNRQLESGLNLSKWWTQDRHFRLAVAARDLDIVFTIRDRTGSEYSFAERSGGLKYFLSYLVQFLTHVKDRESSQILLMDEPDAYLSNQGQQDLLRVLREFTLPTEGNYKGQVVFVTHSPFLIDKNRGDRIRVLDKGAGDEGVRVVRDVGRNHFEPLRTALGSFVGETAFIGNCNLMLEGMADQIYLAGMADLLNRDSEVSSIDCMDLNRITLVPAGSASHIPYMVHLARGRDHDQPAIIVLLDGDEEGKRAAKALQRGGPRNKQLLRPEYVVSFGSDQFPDIPSDRPGKPLEIEDLIPIDLAVAAARAYLEELGAEDAHDAVSADDVRSCMSEPLGVFKAVVAAIEASDSDFHIEKLGFARHVVSLCKEGKVDTSGEMKSRFVELFRHLTSKQRQAERDREREAVSSRIRREIDRFLDDALGTAKRAEVSVLCERIESIIDTSIEGDAVAAEVRRIHADFELDRDRHLPVDDREVLKARLEALRYAGVLASQPDADGVAE